MAIITFWSDEKKQTGQTMSAMAVATNMAIEHNYKILLISTQYDDDTLELSFGNMNNNQSIVSKLVGNLTATVDSGIEGLFRIASSGKTSPDIIQNYTRIVFKNRLEVIYGLKPVQNRQTKEEYERLKGVYTDIIRNANLYYDMVIVDLNKGINSDMTKQILKISDVIVYNIEQKISMINHFQEIRKEINVSKKNNIILNIGKFNKNSKYTVKNISRYLGIKNDITLIPYNTLYFEAADEKNVAELFLKIRKVNENDKNGLFIKQVEETVKKIIYKLKEVQMKM